jgi:hypothetical protein
MGFWPATTDESDIEDTASTTRTRTGSSVVIDSITCAGSTSVGDSVRIQKQTKP